MRCTPLELGALVLDGLGTPDERGRFVKLYDVDVMAPLGVELSVRQCAMSVNDRTRTLRGLHFQALPHTEAKVVACTRGRAFDVVADVRPGSPTFGRWSAVELAADDDRVLFVPPGLAHGFLTLEPGTQLLYLLSGQHVVDAERGVRWDDPTLAVAWPHPPEVVSERDRALPLLTA